jgi:hypothetical protein
VNDRPSCEQPPDNSFFGCGLIMVLVVVYLAIERWH